MTGLVASGSDPTFWAILGFGAGLFYFFKGFRVYRKYRVLADTPEVPIRSIAMGLVEVHGRATGEQQVVSPVSRTPCYFYNVDIDRWETDSKGRGSWRKFRTDKGGVRFYLQDTSGRVLIDMNGAELDLTEYCRREVGGAMRLGLSSLFGGRSTSVLGASDGDLLDYVASVGSGTMLPQVASAASLNPLAASGPISQGDAQSNLDEAVRQMRLKKNAPARGTFSAVADLFRGTSRTSILSGRYRLRECCVLPEFDYDVTGSCVENPSPQDENDRNMITKGDNEPTFLVSCRSEKEIEGALRWRAMKFVFGGGILSVICLAFLLAKLGWM